MLYYKQVRVLLAVAVLLCAGGPFSTGQVIEDGRLEFPAIAEEVIRAATSGKLTTCARHLNITLNHITEMWAMKMIDAASKIPSGLLSGNVADLGSFDQCLSVEYEANDEKIQGKYCKASIPLEKIIKLKSLSLLDNTTQTRGVINLNTPVPIVSLAFCVPSACDAEELNSRLKESWLVKDFDYKVINCQTKDDDTFSVVDWVALGFFIFYFVVLILSTSYDLYVRYYNKEPIHGIFLAFSLYSNGKKLLAVTKNPNQLPCLNGIRFISMMWVIVGHTNFTAFYSPSINVIDIVSWMKQWTSMYTLGATVSVDTFFVLGGLLMSYVFLAGAKKGARFNVIAYYIHRYIRLTPPLAVAILFHVTLLRFLGSGPNWPEVMKSLEVNCTKYWWSTLLYIQNYVNPHNMCISQTWYLSVDMQLFLLSPLALIPLGKWPRRTIQGLCFLVIVSVIIPFTVAWIDELSGLMTVSFTAQDYMLHYYANTLTRFGPIIVGIILGYFVHNRKENDYFNSMLNNKYFKYIGWIVAIGTMMAIVFGANNMYYHEYNKIESSIYVGVHRVVWSLALSWVIYACILGHGGLINTVLSLSVFQVLSRFTYSMYLIHLSFQTMKIGYLRVPIYFSNFQNMYNSWGDFIFTAAIAACWTLAFESPIFIIEKMIFKKPRNN